jgi:hypothetical protein
MELDDIYYHIRQPKRWEDFWELNQEFSYIEPFATFHDEKDSAKIMMAIYMIYDPKSQLANSGESIERVKKDINKNFLGNASFDWKPYRNIVLAYNKYCKTKIEKELDDWWKQLQERKEYMDEDLEWEDNPDLKEKMLKDNDIHFDKFNRIKQSLKEERTENLMHGDYTPSLLEVWALADK